MNKIAIYPGTFDPITFGHIDVIKKGLKLFDKIVVAVSNVDNKNYLFDSEERIQIVKNVSATLKSGLEEVQNNFKTIIMFYQMNLFGRFMIVN